MKVVVLTKREFSNLVCSYRRALYITQFLSYVVEKHPVRDQYFNIEEACEVFEITHRRLKRAYANGEIEAVSSDETLMFSASDVIDLKCKLAKRGLDRLLRKIVQDRSTAPDPECAQAIVNETHSTE